ncbi:MAG: CHRD domain-containing protein [Chitinophagaceae bacterium]|nr:CHRD domain-containing protein [Chitinophagaceae bacterium]
MKLIKLTVLPFLISSLIMVMVSCEPEAEQKKTTDFEKKGIPMTGAQVVPTSPSSALGTLDVSYTKETRILTYKITWSGLVDSVAAVRIHGLAPIGYPAVTSALFPNGIAQYIVGPSTPVTPIYPQKTSGKFTYAKSGSLSGTLLADGVVIKEHDILNGMFYISIYSNAAPYSTIGEIRGQIKFQ